MRNMVSFDPVCLSTQSTRVLALCRKKEQPKSALHSLIRKLVRWNARILRNRDGTRRIPSLSWPRIHSAWLARTSSECDVRWTEEVRVGGWFESERDPRVPSSTPRHVGGLGVPERLDYIIISKNRIRRMRASWP